MRRTILAVFATASVTSALAGQRPPSAADLILRGGQVRTPTGWTRALAIKDGWIVAVGDEAAVARWAGPGTTQIDLAGATVLPGLHDSHVHPIHGGIMGRRCRIAQGSTLDATVRQVKACAATLAPGEWVLGGQWDAPALGGIPSRQALDAAVADRPVLLDDTSGHSVWANSRALAAGGINRSTQDPPGGIIERDGSGEPTGVLRETAASLVRSRAPRPGADAVRAALAASSALMASVGITSFTEASAGFMSTTETELAAYAALADQGLLKQRARLCLPWHPGAPAVIRVIESRNRYARPLVSPDCVKIFLDGVPTDGHTAAMLEPYADVVPGRIDSAASRGILQIPQDILDSAVIAFDRMGLTVKFHAAGDAAVHAGIQAIAAARRANGLTGLLHHVGHSTFVAEADLARAREARATFEVSPYLFSPSPINDAITAAVGAPRIDRVWPVRELVESGNLVVAGSDWAVVPSVNPWIGLETLVTRRVPGGGPVTFGGAEAVPFERAFELFTTNPARVEHRADLVGRLEVGLAADLIVVDQNPFEVPIGRVHDTKVRMTFVAGRKVFDAAAPR